MHVRYLWGVLLAAVCNLWVHLNTNFKGIAVGNTSYFHCIQSNSASRVRCYGYFVDDSSALEKYY